ncbi:Transcriptional regulator PadR-like family protein [Micromonospora pallida]|uniref:Transcriptional regulator PadR-like family protein n=1 Tax=Micromonospora pallida TaxID=145854 RepID=A0A1C6TFP2_9ACTN|nr:helix-turn-helix transcriptional regulator [Micromonospora pallida]SCL40467.1 Transcriptional regulator PadR-like family protein [Micromonospora pallida]
MARTGPRLTPQTVEVLRLLLAEPDRPRYGRDIAHQTELKTGTLHPLLARLELAGWVESFWEDPAAHEVQGRPRRRYYRLTTDGVRAARSAVTNPPGDDPATAAPTTPRPEPNC